VEGIRARAGPKMNCMISHSCP